MLPKVSKIEKNKFPKMGKFPKLKNCRSSQHILWIFPKFLENVFESPQPQSQSHNFQNAQLLPDTRMWKKWANPPYTFKFRVWVYSVKNPDQIMAGAKPELSQMGPYTFDKKLENRVEFLFYKFQENWRSTLNAWITQIATDFMPKITIILIWLWLFL